MVAGDGTRLGSQYESAPERLDPDRVSAYALATNNDNSAYRSGRAVPPVFGVVPVWSVFAAAVADLVPVEARGGLLHAGHDMRFLTPLVTGQVLTSTATVVAVRARPTGSWLTLRLASRNESGQPVTEQFATLFIRGYDAGPSGGSPPPPHPFPAAARNRPVAEVKAFVDHDQAVRYRDASGDANPIHVDDAAARAAGLPGVILHGLCTMAICGQAALSTVDHEPARLLRLAVRFSEPVLPGSDLVTSLYSAATTAQRTTFAFEATSRGRRVVKDGLAEVAN